VRRTQGTHLMRRSWILFDSPHKFVNHFSPVLLPVTLPNLSSVTNNPLPFRHYSMLITTCRINKRGRSETYRHSSSPHNHLYWVFLLAFWGAYFLESFHQMAKGTTVVGRANRANTTQTEIFELKRRS